MTVNRREIVAAIGSTSAAIIAGCTGSSNNNNTDDSSGGEDSHSADSVGVTLSMTDETSGIARTETPNDPYYENGSLVVPVVVETRPDFHEHGDCVTIVTRGMAHNSNGEAVSEYNDGGKAYNEGNKTTVKATFTENTDAITRVELTLDLDPDGGACNE